MSPEVAHNGLWYPAGKVKRGVSMKEQPCHMSMRRAAIVAGAAYLAMFVPAIFANFFVLSGLVVEGDAATTTQNILANELLFRGGTASLLAVAVLDIVVAIGLYVFLAPAGKTLSLAGAWFRVAYSAVFAASLTSLAMIPGLLHEAGSLGEQLQTQVLLSVNTFNTGWMVGLLLFGVHLLAIGYLAFKSGYVPRLIGVLLLIAGLGYLVDTLGFVLVPGYALSLGQYTFIGELAFPVWLLIRGGKESRRASEA